MCAGIGLCWNHTSSTIVTSIQVVLLCVQYKYRMDKSQRPFDPVCDLLHWHYGNADVIHCCWLIFMLSDWAVVSLFIPQTCFCTQNDQLSMLCSTVLVAGVDRQIESCRHKWLLLGPLHGHLVIFTLQIFCFCRHMWRCADHLPTSAACQHGQTTRFQISTMTSWARNSKMKQLNTCLQQIVISISNTFHRFLHFLWIFSYYKMKGHIPYNFSNISFIFSW